MNPKLRKLVPIIFAGLMGLVGLMLVQGFMKKQQEQVQAEKKKIMEQLGPPIQIVVASKPIAQGEIITPQHLGFKKVPQVFVQPNVVRDPESIFKKQAVLDIAEGEHILVNKIREPIEKGPDKLAQLMPKGSRAVSIEADISTGVGGLIKAGDLVDVIWVTDSLDRMGATGKRSAAVTLFQAVPVLAINSELYKPPQFKDEFAKEDDSNRSSRARKNETTVTLALTPEGANLLLYARTRGEIQLSLRSPNEQLTQVTLQPIDDAALVEAALGAGIIPEPVTRKDIEVFKGLERTVVSVEEKKKDGQ